MRGVCPRCVRFVEAARAEARDGGNPATIGFVEGIAQDLLAPRELVLTAAAKILGSSAEPVCVTCARVIDTNVERLEKRWLRARERGENLERQKPHGKPRVWLH